MQKTLLCLCFLVLLNARLDAQKVSGKLVFEQGKTLTVNIAQKTTIAQQAMGQAIDFTTSGEVRHTYKVTNATEDNTTLHHQMIRLSFDFDGMGTKKSFDSDNKKDLDGEFGKPVKEMLGKNYDIIIDASGKTLLSKPEKIEPAGTDDRTRIVFDMLRDITGVLYPPQKGEPGFFKILPDQELTIGDTWTESRNTDTAKSTTLNTLSAVTDSTIVVDFKTNASTKTTSEIMGMSATTNMTSIITGKIILDKATGLMKEKTSLIESTGNTEMMGTMMPLTSKSTITITVNPEK